MDISVGCNICKVCMYMSIGNTTDIKLADRFSRAVNFFSLTRLHDLLVGRLFCFFRNKDKNKYARRYAYLMHKVLRYRYHSLLCIVDSSFPFIFHYWNRYSQAIQSTT